MSKKKKRKSKPLAKANRALKRIERDFGDNPEFIDWVLEDAYLAAKGKTGRVAVYEDQVEGNDCVVLFGNQKDVDQIHAKMVAGVPAVRGYFKRPSAEAMEHVLAPKFPGLFREPPRVMLEGEDQEKSE